MAGGAIATPQIDLRLFDIDVSVLYKSSEILLSRFPIGRGLPLPGRLVVRYGTNP
jgi:hypothetical protein